MNPLEFTPNGTTRRNFMKKTALTVGAVAILSQGCALAEDTGPTNAVKKKHTWGATYYVPTQTGESAPWHACACGAARSIFDEGDEYCTL